MNNNHIKNLEDESKVEPVGVINSNKGAGRAFLILLVLIILSAYLILNVIVPYFPKESAYTVYEVQLIAEEAWNEAYSKGIRHVFDLETAVKDAFEEKGIDANDYKINVTETGVTIKEQYKQR